jgi:Tol biopolymer transport system component
VLDEMAFGVALSPDARSVAFCRLKADLSTIELMVGSSDGTGGRLLRTYKAPQRDPGQPHWSADGREIVVTDLADDKSQVLVALNVGDGTARRLTQRTWPMIRSSVWLADGRGFLISASERRARPQVWHISPTGEARQLTHDFLGFDEISATSDGDTIAATTFDIVATIWTGDVDARSVWKPIEQGAGRSDGFRGIDWTADGRIIYSATVAGVYQLSVMDADGSRRRQLTFGAGSTFPAVSPDGQSIAFSQNAGTRTTIHVMDLDGSNVREVSDVEAGRATWTPDGRSIIFKPLKEGPEVRRVPAAGGPSSVISTDLFNVPKVSPDGRWLAGLTEEGQRIRVAIEPYPGGGAKRVLDIPASDTGVDWTADSRGLLVARDGNLWSYPIDGGPPAQVTRLEGDPIVFWAVAPDGRLAAVRVRQTSDIVTITGLRALTGGK